MTIHKTISNSSHSHTWRHENSSNVVFYTGKQLHWSGKQTFLPGQDIIPRCSVPIQHLVYETIEQPPTIFSYSLRFRIYLNIGRPTITTSDYRSYYYQSSPSVIMGIILDKYIHWVVSYQAQTTIYSNRLVRQSNLQCICIILEQCLVETLDLT